MNSVEMNPEIGSMTEAELAKEKRIKDGGEVFCKAARLLGEAGVAMSLVYLALGQNLISPNSLFLLVGLAVIYKAQCELGKKSP